MRDRYAIYKMIGKRVRFRLPVRLGGRSADGVASRVYRNVLDNLIEIAIGSKVYIFREPASVELDDGQITFVYGDDNPATDKQFWDEQRAAANWGQGVESVFKTLDRNHFSVRFTISKPPPIRRNPRNTKRLRKSNKIRKSISGR